MKNTTLCFSGHRRYEATAAAEACLAAAIEAAWDDGYRVFISGIAMGFDLAAAEAVVRARGLHAGIKLVAAVPFAGQQSGYSLVDRARYDAVLSAADEVWMLAERYSHGCFYRRDDRMVEHSGRIVCWWDGSGGGTRYTVRVAARAGLEVVNLFGAAERLF